MGSKKAIVGVEVVSGSVLLETYRCMILAWHVGRARTGGIEMAVVLSC